MSNERKSRNPTDESFELRVARWAQDAHLRRDRHLSSFREELDHLPHQRAVARRVAVRRLDHRPHMRLELVGGQPVRELRRVQEDAAVRAAGAEDDGFLDVGGVATDGELDGDCDGFS